MILEAGSFGLLDWGIVVGLLVATTILGERLAGEQTSERDFFLGGRNLPWFAVAASIVATEISAATFIGLPATVYGAGGNLAYLQIGLLGSLVARCVVAFVLIPAYYEREIYSPYDYVGNRLGPGAKATTTTLFSLGGILAQGSRVYLAARVLGVLLHDELAWLEQATGIPAVVASVAVIGFVAVLWTWIGGIAAVVWTDGILFCLFVIGAFVTLFTIAGRLPGGLEEIWTTARSAGKTRLLFWSWDLRADYTIASAVLGASWGMIGAYGTDQLMAQRFFCCRTPRDAQKAVLASYVAMLLTVLVCFVGLGLFAYYERFPLEGEARALVEANANDVFAVFARFDLPVGLRGLILAGVFAAAISSLDSILAALGQTTLSAWRLARGSTEGSGDVVRSMRLLVLGWGVVLCAVASVLEPVEQKYGSILNLCLAMAAYTQGGLLAAFLLAFASKRPDGSGIVWSAPLSVLAVFGLVWHDGWAVDAAIGLGATWLVAFALLRRPRTPREWVAAAAGAAVPGLLAGFATIEGDSVSWPWHAPVGLVVALVLGVLLRRPRGAA